MAKKYVLVIVEGASDKAALEVLFTRFCCPKGTETIVTHGDITSDKNVSESNIINKVCRHIKDFASERKLNRPIYSRLYTLLILMVRLSLTAELHRTIRQMGSCILIP